MVEHLAFSEVLVDLDLNGKKGTLLMQQLRTSFPELPIIAASGVLQAPEREQHGKLRAVEVLQKPIPRDWKPIVEGSCKDGRVDCIGGIDFGVFPNRNADLSGDPSDAS